jgi:hypothetical protein
LEDTRALARRSQSRSLSPPSPAAEQPSSFAPVFPSGLSDMARVVQYFMTMRQAFNRPLSAEGKTRTLMEASHEAQMAAQRAAHSPTPGGQSVSFIPNKGQPPASGTSIETVF